MVYVLILNCLPFPFKQFQGTILSCQLVTWTCQFGLIMEELSARFPHLGENILLSLDFQSLINCKEVARNWKKIMEFENPRYLKIIKRFTECSDEILKNVLKKSGSAIVLVSILYEIFGKFARGTKQRNHYLKNWDNTPLHEAAINGHVAVYQLIMDKVKDKNPKIRGRNVTPLHFAAEKGHLRLYKLISHNVKSFCPLDIKGYTPHYYALKNNRIEVIHYTIQALCGPILISR